MSEKNLARALALALEAEHEAEQVHDTYQGISDVLDVEKSLSEVDQSSDIAEGLESLSIVLENLAELDLHDITMVQVIGDIAGASTGVSGAYFTPAMESMDDDDQPTASQKAKVIIDRAREMLKRLYEKIIQLFKHVQARFMAMSTSASEVLKDLHSSIGKKITAGKVAALKRKLGDMNAFSEIIDEFISMMSWLTTCRELAVETFLRQGKLSPIVTADIERVYKRMGAFSNKFGIENYPCSVKFEVEMSDAHELEDLGIISSFMKSGISVKRGFLERAPESSVDEGEEGVFTEELYDECQRVIKEIGKHTARHGAANLVELNNEILRAIKKLSEGKELNDIPETEGMPVGALMTQLVSALNRDSVAVVKVSQFVIMDGFELMSKLKAITGGGERTTLETAEA